jgi:hypothetical protein
MFLFNLIVTLLLTFFLLHGCSGDGDQAASNPPVTGSPIVAP